MGSVLFTATVRKRSGAKIEIEYRVCHPDADLPDLDENLVLNTVLDYLAQIQVKNNHPFIQELASSHMLPSLEPGKEIQYGTYLDMEPPLNFKTELKNRLLKKIETLSYQHDGSEYESALVRAEFKSAEYYRKLKQGMVAEFYWARGSLPEKKRAKLEVQTYKTTPKRIVPGFVPYDRSPPTQFARGKIRHTQSIKGLAFLPDGRLVSGCEDGLILTHTSDLKTAEVLRDLEHPIREIKTSRGGRFLVVRHGLLYIFDAKTLKFICARSHGGGVAAVEFTADDSRMLTGSGRWEGWLWETELFRPVFKDHSGGLRPAISADGKRYVSLEDSTPQGPVLVKSATNGRALKKFHRWPHYFAFSKGRLLIFDEKELNIYQGSAYEKTATVRLKARDYWDAPPAINESRGLIALPEERRVILWNVEGKRVHVITAKAAVTSVALSHDGARIAIGTKKGELILEELPASIEHGSKKSGAKAKLAAGSGKPAKKTAGKKKATGKAYLEHRENSPGKFWSVTVEGPKQIVQYGRIGSYRQQKVSYFDSNEEARADADKQIAAKIKKGYKKARPKSR